MWQTLSFKNNAKLVQVYQTVNSAVMHIDGGKPASLHQ